MTANRSVFDREATVEDLREAKTRFWQKMRDYAGKLPFAREAVALFYYVKDPRVALAAKGVGVLALLYFIWPADVVPDAVPLVGLLDDAGVIAGAVAALSAVLGPYKEKATEWFKRGARPEPEEVRECEVTGVR